MFSLFADGDFAKINDTASLKVKTLPYETAKIKLNNGLNVYLISNKKAEKSAAALMVQAGSWQDPKEYPGMAHFVEHMLFKGTTAYPEENDYFRFVMENGGSANAFTMPYLTSYIFSINNDLFEKTLDRFSYFFISPLFKASAINRELHAVDEEHKKNIENDGWRLYQISKETGNPNHPNSKFSTGTAATLSKIPLDELKKWYATHYSANVMTLVVYSALPLEQLTTLVVEKFKNVPNNEVEPLKINELLSSFQQRGHITYIKPVQQQKILQLSWELPTKFIKDENKSAALISYALSRGQENSLNEILKNANLAEAVVISADDMGKYHTVFSVMIKLTDYGLNNVNKVLETIFSAINMLKEKTIPQSLFDEMNMAAKIQYEYAEEIEAFSTVTRHALNLCTEELTSYPDKTILASGYDQQKVLEILSCLTVQDCQYCLVCDPTVLNIVLDKKEEWMQGEYTIKPLDDKLINTLSHPQVCEVKLPSVNIYMPQNLDNVAEQSSVENLKKIEESGKGKIFYYSSSFPQPTCSYCFNIKSPLLTSEAKNQVLKDIFLQAAEQKLTPHLNSARPAGISASLSPGYFNIFLTIDGFEEKASLLLDNVLTTLKNCIISEEQFNIICNSLAENYQNVQKALPLRQALDNFSSLMRKEAITQEEKSNVIKQITFADFNNFVAHLFDYAYIEGVISGHLAIADAKSLWNKLTTNLNFLPYPDGANVKSEILTFEGKDIPALITKNTNAAGTGIILCLDQGNYTFQKEAAQQVASQIMWEAFFTSLRSKQKVAYIAQSAAINEEQHLFAYFLLQSSSNLASNLLTRMDIFLDDFVQEINTHISEDRFNEVKKSTIVTFSLPPKNIFESTQRILNMAFDKSEDFLFYEKRIKAITELTYADFINFCKETLGPSNQKRLAVAACGKLPLSNTLTYNNTTPQNIKTNSKYVTAKKIDICDLTRIYNDQYQYFLPKDILENYLSGKAFDNLTAYSPEELQKLKTDIEIIYANILSKNPTKERLAVVTAGAPGSGKTTKMQQDLQQQAALSKNYAYINPDDLCLQQQLNTYKSDINNSDGSIAAKQLSYNKWRPGSNAATHVILANLIRDNYAIYFDTTSTGKYSVKLFSFLKDHNYQIRLMHVTAPDDVRLQSIQEMNKIFIHTTEKDVKEKALLLPQQIKSTYLAYADEIEFYYRSAVNEDAILAAKWKKSTNILEIIDPLLYSKIKAWHNANISSSDLLWETVVEKNVKITLH